MSFTKQINRIKLELARITDKYLEVFGSNSHRYILNPPIFSSEVNDFENKFSISLPECYKAFLTQIGNGGTGHLNSGAGPYYGIFNLGNDYQLVGEGEMHHSYLQKEPYFNSQINKKIWAQQYKKIGNNLNDDEFYEYVSDMYAGVLNIGECGCNGYIGIMIKGIDKGRVLKTYYDPEYCPSFEEESNFLDWYESWLDKVISGDSIFDSVSITNEKEDSLLRNLSNNKAHRFFYYLSKIRSLDSLSKSSLESLREQYKVAEEPIKEYILDLLIKFDYQNSKSELEQYYNNPIEILRIIHLFAPNKLNEWISFFSDLSSFKENLLLSQYLNYVQTKKL